MQNTDTQEAIDLTANKQYKGKQVSDFEATEESRKIFRDNVTSCDKDTVYSAYDKMGAECYESAMLSAGYPDPAEVTKLITELGLSKDICIGDIGCGTGLASEILAKLGYTNLYGYDPSEELRKAAMAKGIFKDVGGFLLD